MVKYLFIDESGDHNLDPNKFDSTFPIFVLTGIVFEAGDYKLFKTRVSAFKKDIFGKKNILLHAREITRPNIASQPEIAKLTDKDKRRIFYDKLNYLLEKSKFKIISFYIDKKWVINNLGESPPDPYFLSFSFIADNFAKILKIGGGGIIFAENRDKFLDKKFLLAWEDSKLGHNYQNIKKPHIVKKVQKVVGIEVADIVCYRLARNLLGKKEKIIGNELNIKILEDKKPIISGLPEDKQN